MSWDDKELAEKLKDNPDLKVMQENPLSRLAPLLEKKHKYHAKRTEYNGVYYASKKEAQRAQDNDLRIQAGELSFYLTQVPFRLPSTVYRLDFMEFKQVVNTPLYEVEFIEVKGIDLPLGKMKRKQAESLYNIHIEVV